MQEEEWLQEATCAVCGVELDPGRDDAFVFGETGILCFECALQRGGVFDSEQDRWVRPPRVADLPEARRPLP